MLGCQQFQVRILPAGFPLRTQEPASPHTTPAYCMGVVIRMANRSVADGSANGWTQPAQISRVETGLG